MAPVVCLLYIQQKSVMSKPVYQTVILGGGFAGLFTALHLSHHHYPRSVILIDSEERFAFKPLLYEYFSGEMDANQVWPRFDELLKGSGIIFVKDSAETVDLKNREVKLASGNCYNYSNLVLAVGSVTGYFGVEGARENALPLRMGEDALALDKQLRECLQRAAQMENPEQRRNLLTVAVIGGGPSGIEIACTVAELLPDWYKSLGGNPEEIRVVMLNHGKEILEGDVNNILRPTAEQELKKRQVELILGAEATAIRPDAVEYKQNDKQEKLLAATTIWTTGTNTHPLIKNLDITKEHRDKHERLQVTPTLQLLDFPEVFAGGDCAAMQGSSLPPTAQVAYQQGAAIAHNLKALVMGEELKPAEVNLLGTLLKLGIENSAASLFNRFEVTGEAGNVIRQGRYLELLPTPIHNFKATTEWLNEEIFNHHLNPVKTGDVVKWVGGALVGALVARKLVQMLGEDHKNSQT